MTSQEELSLIIINKLILVLVTKKNLSHDNFIINNTIFYFSIKNFI